MDCVSNLQPIFSGFVSGETFLVERLGLPTAYRFSSHQFRDIDLDDVRRKGLLHMLLVSTTSKLGS